MLLRETRRSLSEIQSEVLCAASAGIPPCASAPRIYNARLLSAAVGRCPPQLPAASCGDTRPPYSLRDGGHGKFVTALTRAWCRALLLLSGVTLSLTRESAAGLSRDAAALGEAAGEAARS